jgi:hypothetical protein
MFSLGLSPIAEKSIEHKIVNQTAVRLTWPKHPFSVQPRLRNIETNYFESLAEFNETSALFTNLTEASIYQVEFNISKPNFLSINQTTEYYIQTGKFFLMSP